MDRRRQGPTSHREVGHVSLCRDSGGVGECLLVSGGPQVERNQAKGPERETGLYSGRSVRLGCSEQVGRREKFLSVSEVTDMASIQSLKRHGHSQLLSDQQPFTVHSRDHITPSGSSLPAPTTRERWSTVAL